MLHDLCKYVCMKRTSVYHVLVHNSELEEDNCPPPATSCIAILYRMMITRHSQDRSMNHVVLDDRMMKKNMNIHGVVPGTDSISRPLGNV